MLNINLHSSNLLLNISIAVFTYSVFFMFTFLRYRHKRKQSEVANLSACNEGFEYKLPKEQLSYLIGYNRLFTKNEIIFLKKCENCILVIQNYSNARELLHIDELGILSVNKSIWIVLYKYFIFFIFFIMILEGSIPLFYHYNHIKNDHLWLLLNFPPTLLNVLLITFLIKVLGVIFISISFLWLHWTARPFRAKNALFRYIPSEYIPKNKKFYYIKKLLSFTTK